MQKDALFKELLALMISSLEAGILSPEDSEAASRFIVDKIETAKNADELEALVSLLGEKWPCFKPAMLSFRESQALAEDESKLTEAQNEIETLKSQVNTN